MTSSAPRPASRIAFLGLLAAAAGCRATPPGNDLAFAATAASDGALATVAQDPPSERSDAPVARRGVQVALLGGFGFLADTDIAGDAASGLGRGSARFDGGPAWGGAIGYRFDDDWSADVELMYRTNDLDRLTTDAGAALGDGDFSSLSVFANGRYRLPVEGAVRPYVGAGLGWVQEIDIDFVQAGVETSFSDRAFGAQVMAGAEWLVTERFAVSLEGRYVKALGFDLEDEGSGAALRDADYDRLEVLIGAGWTF